jgi:hypothetical protein
MARDRIRIGAVLAAWLVVGVVPLAGQEAVREVTQEAALRESLRRSFRDLHAYLLARDPGS